MGLNWNLKERGGLKKIGQPPRLLLMENTENWKVIVLSGSRWVCHPAFSSASLFSISPEYFSSPIIFLGTYEKPSLAQEPLVKSKCCFFLVLSIKIMEGGSLSKWEQNHIQNVSNPPKENRVLGFIISLQLLTKVRPFEETVLSGHTFQKRIE